MHFFGNARQALFMKTPHPAKLWSYENVAHLCSRIFCLKLAKGTEGPGLDCLNKMNNSKNHTISHKAT